VSDLPRRLNAAIQEAELQANITNRHAEELRWREHLWVLRAARDEISRLRTFEHILTTSAQASQLDIGKRETLTIKNLGKGT